MGRDVMSRNKMPDIENARSAFMQLKIVFSNADFTSTLEFCLFNAMFGQWYSMKRKAGH